MGYGPFTYFETSIQSNVTLGSAIDLGRAWEKCYLFVPSMASGDVFIQAAEKLDGTFKRVCVDMGNTSTAQMDFKIPSTVTNRVVPIPNYLRFIKVESSSGTTDVTTTFRVFVGG